MTTQMDKLAHAELEKIRALSYAMDRIEKAMFAPKTAPEVTCIECGAGSTIAAARSWYIENNGEAVLCDTCRDEESGR